MVWFKCFGVSVVFVLALWGCHGAERVPAESCRAPERIDDPPERLTNLDRQTVWFPNAELIQVYDLTAAGDAGKLESPDDGAREFVLRVSDNEVIRAPVRRLR